MEEFIVTEKGESSDFEPVLPRKAKPLFRRRGCLHSVETFLTTSFYLLASL